MSAIDTTRGFGAAPPNMDWLHKLLPPGGKVGITVSHPTPAAGTAVPGSANGNPLVQNPTATPGPAGPGAVAPGVAPGRTGPAAPAVPAAPHDVNPNDGNWWNPYTGKQENIPGVNAAGIITDPNAFWTYYSNNKSGILDALATQLSKGGATNFQKPIDYNSIVTGDEGYQSGLSGINLNRWMEALNYGDPSVFAGMGMTPEQQQAIINNPNSQLNALRRSTTKANYDANSGIASHGAWSSGARNQAIENNTLDDIRSQQGYHDQALGKAQSFDQAQTDLFRDVKTALEKDGKFDSGDQEHNQAIYNATHKVITDTTKAAVDLAHKHPTSGQDAQHLIDAINAALKDHGKMFGADITKQLTGRLAYLKEVIRQNSSRQTVIGRDGGTITQAMKNSKLGGSLAGGPKGYTRP